MLFQQRLLNGWRRALPGLLLFPMCAFPATITVDGAAPIVGAAPLAFAGVDAGTGYAYDGVIKVGAACAVGGGIVGFMMLDVCLTDFAVNRPLGAAVGGNLTFTFSESFPGPLPAGAAADIIIGSFTAGVGAGDTLRWQGFANGVAIAPPPGAIVRVDPPLAFAPGLHGPLFIGATPAGGALVLSGSLTVNLAVLDGVTLPNSAEVAFEAIPEPCTFQFIGIGGLCLVGKWLRRRSLGAPVA
jgi:hypothetical protein